MNRTEIGTAVYMRPEFDTKVTKTQILDFGSAVQKIIGKYDGTDLEEPGVSRVLVYLVLGYREFKSSKYKDTLAYVAEYIFGTKIVILLNPNERINKETFSGFPVVFGLDLRETEFASDKTRAVVTLRANIQNTRDLKVGDQETADSMLRLIVAPRRFRLELMVLSLTSGADLAIDLDQYTTALRARYFAASNMYYELSRAKNVGGAMYGYSRLAMEYFTGNDSAITVGRHEKTAHMLSAGGPYVMPEYAEKFMIDPEVPKEGEMVSWSPEQKFRMSVMKSVIQKYHNVATQIRRVLGMYRTQVVGSMSSLFKDLVPGDIDIVIAVADTAEFRAALHRLRVHFGAMNLRVDTKTPVKASRVLYAEHGLEKGNVIKIDIFAVESLTSMEAHSRVLSSIENLYYRTLAKEQGYVLNDKYLEVSPGQKIRDMREIIRVLGVEHPGIDIRDLRNWYFGLIKY